MQYLRNVIRDCPRSLGRAFAASTIWVARQSGLLHVPDNCVRLALARQAIRSAGLKARFAGAAILLEEDKYMATNPKPGPRQSSGLTRPGDLYVQGDDLPLPEVNEKNTDSVWALWSDLVDESAESKKGAGNEKAEIDKPDLQRDFQETVPLDLDSIAATQLMDLPDFPKDG